MAEARQLEKVEGLSVDDRECRKNHAWLCLMAVVGLLLVTVIFWMLFHAPAQRDTVIQQHSEQMVR